MDYWIQKTHLKKGALHKQLGYGAHETIPKGLLGELAGANIGTHVRGHKVTHLLKKRASLAYNLEHLHHRRK